MNMSSAPTKWGILIAIDFYPKPAHRLEGCVNDINDIEAWLHANHDSMNITKLSATNTGSTDQKLPLEPATEWPTYENVKGSIQKVTRDAKPGDLVYIHYCGHGALKPQTAQYEENDGSDSALVLLHVQEEIRYLKGIELASLFDDMVKKKLKLTVILDCCCIASLSRNFFAPYIHIRGIQWDSQKGSVHPDMTFRESIKLASNNRRLRDASSRQHWLLIPEGYALIAACGPNEIAGECSGEDGRKHGVLSYLLLKILVSAVNEGDRVTIGSIYRKLRAKLHALPQHPLLLGNASTTFLGNAIERSNGPHGCHSTSSIVKASGVDQIWLDIGYAHGVCLGDVFAIHPKDLQIHEVMNDVDVSEVNIISVEALQSQAELIRLSKRETSIRAGWYATHIRRSCLKLQVIVLGGSDARWTEAIDKSVWLHVTELQQVNLSAPALVIDVSEESRVNIFDASKQEIQNLPLVSTCDTTAVTKTVLTLEHLAKFHFIEHIHNQSETALGDNDFAIEVRPENLERDCVVDEDSPDEIQVFEEEKLKITFKNNTKKPLHLTVLNLRPLREIKRLFPPRDRGSWRVVQPKSLNPNSEFSGGLNDNIKFPGEISFKVTMSLPEAIKSNGVSQVKDIFKFFVTTRPSAFDSLELPALTQEALKPNRGSNSSDLSNTLQKLAVGRQPSSTLRGEGGKSPERWGCSNVVIKTSRKETRK